MHVLLIHQFIGTELRGAVLVVNRTEKVLRSLGHTTSTFACRRGEESADPESKYWPRGFTRKNLQGKQLC